MADDRMAVQGTMDRMIAGYKTREIDMILSTYTQQAAYAAVPGEPTVGQEDLRTVQANCRDQSRIHLSIRRDRGRWRYRSSYEARMPGTMLRI